MSSSKLSSLVLHWSALHAVERELKEVFDFMTAKEKKKLEEMKEFVGTLRQKILDQAHEEEAKIYNNKENMYASS